MTCGLSIATRAGGHFPCMLEDQHDGACIPRLPLVAVPGGISFEQYWSAAREADFIGHLLAVVEAAGQTLTFLEALNIARALCRTRLGIPERRL